MNRTPSRGARIALKSVQDTYGFMLASGYEVVSVEDFDLGWQVVLRKQEVFAKIIRSRGEEEIYFRRGALPADEFTSMGSVIYAATGDKIPPWESSDRKVIERYLDKVESYFENEYVRNRDSLRVAQEEYRAAFARDAVASPPEPSATPVPEPSVSPILQYPLIAVILLLLFGALTTLYAVLLDRLFSVISLNAGSYSIFTGFISLVLAIATMLLFWRWRKKD